MKRIAVWFFKFASIAIALVFAGVLVPRPLVKPAIGGQGTTTIYVSTNPIHSDIVIPLDEQTRRIFAFLAVDGLPLENPQAEWLVIGWGGRAFYIETPTWSAIRPIPVLKALTVDSAVMHVELTGALKLESPSLIPIQIDDDAYASVLAEIVATFRRDPNGEPELIDSAAYGDFDQFYAANGWFNALVGCNTWTARVLRTAGVRTGWWNPFPQSLRLSLVLYN